GFVLIVYGFAHVTDPSLAGKNPQLWVPPLWMKHITFLLMLPACIFLVAAY
ncbi:NnrU family protein, partial [Vibrio parahaemolyticus]